MVSRHELRTHPGDILIVDDEIPNLQLLTHILSKDGYQVRPADCPQLALDAAIKQPPCLILLDVKMPGMDGFEVCRRLKLDIRTHDIPVIFISALQDEHEKLRGFEAGAVDFISKPFGDKEVLARVRAQMDLHNMQLHLEELVAERTVELKAEITERERADEKLRYQATVLKNVSDAIISLDNDYKIVSWNKFAEQIYGWSAEEVIDKSYQEVTKPVYKDGQRAEIIENMSQNIFWKGEIEEQHKDGSRIIIQTSISAIKDEKGNIIGSVGVNRDITAAKEIEQDVRIFRQALVKAERNSSLGELSGSIAHELNQPLTGILSNAQSLGILLERDQEGGDQFKEIVTHIVADTKRAGVIIRNLESVFRNRETQFQSLDLNDLIKDTLSLVKRELVIQHVTLDTQLTAPAPTITGNKVELLQVLINLLTNASQAMNSMPEAERKIRLGTESPIDGMVTIWVEDSGPGIDADLLPGIFDAFSTSKKSGMGIGLAICRGIIESHGGRIYAKNKPGSGARFYFSVPESPAHN